MFFGERTVQERKSDSMAESLAVGDLLCFHQRSGDVPCQVLDVFEDGRLVVRFQHDDSMGIVMRRHCSRWSEPTCLDAEAKGKKVRVS